MQYGSGYTVIIEFYALKPGKTTAKIECRSPIADNFDAVYEIDIDDALMIKITELERIQITE